MKKFFIILFAFVVAFLTFGAMQANSPEGKAKAAAREAIKICRADAAKASISTIKIIEGTCEMMEEDFRKKYGVNP